VRRLWAGFKHPRGQESFVSDYHSACNSSKNYRGVGKHLTRAVGISESHNHRLRRSLMFVGTQIIEPCQRNLTRRFRQNQRQRKQSIRRFQRLNLAPGSRYQPTVASNLAPGSRYHQTGTSNLALRFAPKKPDVFLIPISLAVQ
jgi:hypothetical protein